MRRLTKRCGQSSLEYLLVFTAIIAAITLALPTIKDKIQSAFEYVSTEMKEQVEKIDY